MGIGWRYDILGRSGETSDYGGRQGKVVPKATGALRHWIGGLDFSKDVSSNIDFTKKQISGDINFTFTASLGQYTSAKTIGIISGLTWNEAKNIDESSWSSVTTGTTILGGKNIGIYQLTVPATNLQKTGTYTLNYSSNSNFFKCLNNSLLTGNKWLIFFSIDDRNKSINDIGTSNNSDKYTTNFIGIKSPKISIPETSLSSRGGVGSFSDLTVGSAHTVTVTDTESRNYKVIWSLGGTKLTKKGGSSTTFSLDASETSSFGPEIISTTSLKGLVTIETYTDSNYSTLVGSWSSALTYKIGFYTLSTTGISVTISDPYYNSSGTAIYAQGVHSIAISASSTTSFTKKYGVEPYIEIYSASSSTPSTSPDYTQVGTLTSKNLSIKIPLTNTYTYYKCTVKDVRTASNISTAAEKNGSFTSTSLTDGISFTGVSIGRCESDGTSSTSGRHFLISGALINAEYDSVLVKKGETNITTNFTVDSSNKNKGIISPTNTSTHFAGDSSYTIIITLKSTKYFTKKDSSGKVSVPLTRNYTFEAGSSEYLLHFHKDGKAIGIGSAAEAPATGQNGLVTVGWPMKLTNGFLLRETAGSSTYKPITNASQLGGSGTSITKDTSLQIKTLTVGSKNTTTPSDGDINVAGKITTGGLKVDGIDFSTGSSSLASGTKYYLPIVILNSIPTGTPAQGTNVIYFVKSST